MPDSAPTCRDCGLPGTPDDPIQCHTPPDHPPHIDHEWSPGLRNQWAMARPDGPEAREIDRLQRASAAGIELE